MVIERIKAYSKDYKEKLNHLTTLVEKGKIKIIKCYPIKNQIVIKYEENEEV